MKTELFGTMLKPHVRWVCWACKTNNVTAMAPPLREKERVFCRKCRRLTVITVDLPKTPKVWGGWAADPRCSIRAGSDRQADEVLA